MIYKCRHFDLQELVAPEIYAERASRAWELLDVYALVTFDQLRDKFGPIVINDWHHDGLFKYSGLRPWDCETGAKWSDHKYGRAGDLKPLRATPQEMYAYILAHQDEFPYLRSLENIGKTPSWVHVSTRYHLYPHIWVVNP